MQFKSLLAMAMLAPALLFSCKKKDDNKGNLANDMVYVDYGKYTPGNYWVYEVYDVDSDGNGSSSLVKDSIYVEKDTLINSKTYHKLMSPEYAGAINYVPAYLRDSLHYIVDRDGNICFSSVDFSTVFRSYYYKNPAISPVDSVGLMEERMANKDKPFVAGGVSYTTSDFQIIWNMHPVFWSAGKTRILHHRYAAGIGMVSETLPFFAASPGYQERRLIRYHVN